MLRVIAGLAQQLEDQLREDGYKGTKRAMRILKELRRSLAAQGYGSVEPASRPVKGLEAREKNVESFSETLDDLV